MRVKVNIKASVKAIIKVGINHISHGPLDSMGVMGGGGQISYFGKIPKRM